MSNKQKHLEMLQNVINRMASNSFLLKGWSVTLVSALFALAANDANPRYIIIAYIPIPIFWILDGFYLSQERAFRELYNNVCTIADDNLVTFSMDKTAFLIGRNSWIESIFSITLNIFYLSLIFVVLIAMFLI
jgi:hypothetical protein